MISVHDTKEILYNLSYYYWVKDAMNEAFN